MMRAWLVLVTLGLTVLAGSAAHAAEQEAATTPLPWTDFTDAAVTASDRQPFRCESGEHGVKVKLRGGQDGDSYGYFRVRGDRWIVVRYPDDRGDPDHIWFGTSAPGNPTALTVVRDEPFDHARHTSPCAGWLLH
jgi:hypothetical protein